jgi:inorganic pyrophosphatase
VAETVHVRIETPRFSFQKRNSELGRDYRSPIPCPFNYGSLPGTRAPDGEPEDALVLGPRLALGTLCERRVLAVVGFVDAGVRDDKLVCGQAGELERVGTRVLLRAFFSFYAALKRVRNRLAGRGGPTRYEGLRAL